MTSVQRRSMYVIGALGCVALIIRLVPLIRFGPFGFGYDSGFYRRYLIEPFASFPNMPVPGLDHTVFIPRILLDIVRFIVHQPDITLYGTYVVCSLVGAGCVWYFARHYVPDDLSRYAAALYVLSGIQFLAYADFFFKEAVALPIFLFAILCFEREWYGWATALGVLVVLTQQTTSIILICVAGLGFLIRVVQTRTVSIRYIFSSTIVLAAYLLLHPHVAQKVASPPVGIFVTQGEYLLWSLPFILLAIIGARRWWPVIKHNALFGAALLVPLAFALFHLPFYNRIYTFLDMFVVILASFGVDVITDSVRIRFPRLVLPTIIALCIMVSIPLVYLEATQTPLIDGEAQATLATLLALPSKGAIITSPRLLPWVQGWSTALVYAPGNLKEPHSSNDWGQYWTHQNPQFERSFLASFPQPLYVFAQAQEMMYRPACAIQTSPGLFSFVPCK